MNEPNGRDESGASEGAAVQVRVERFHTRASVAIADTASFEDAAQAFATALYAEFQDVVVLSRVFAVIPYAKLPRVERDYVAAYVGKAAASSFEESMPVMTLFGTRGIDGAWNDRTRSRDHRAIALRSGAFVEDAPMLAKLFSELGGPLGARGGAEWQLVNTTADGHGLFFVGDARTTTDERGRRVIPSEDFVERYGVRTVFGFGGHSAEKEMSITAVVFCRRSLMRAFAGRFIRSIDVLRAGARESIARGTLFARSSGGD